MLVEVTLFPLTLVGGAFGTAITLKSYKNHSTCTETGAHNLERATSMYSCHGVFTDKFIFRKVLARI